MKTFLISLLIFSFVNAQTIEEYEKQIDEIKDEKLKEIVRQKIAQQIADKMTNTSKQATQSSQNANEDKESKIDPIVTQTSDEKLKIVLALNTSIIELRESPKDIYLSGSEFALGYAKYYKSNKYRLRSLLTYTTIELDEKEKPSEIQIFDKIAYKDELSYYGYGLKFVFTEFITPKFGFGAYASAIKGYAKMCSVQNSCKKNLSIETYELGFRFDLKFGSWTPFMQLGIMNYEGVNEPYWGKNLSIGILNFEF